MPFYVGSSLQSLLFLRSAASLSALDNTYAAIYLHLHVHLYLSLFPYAITHNIHHTLTYYELQCHTVNDWRQLLQANYSWIACLAHISKHLEFTKFHVHSTTARLNKPDTILHRGKNETESEQQNQRAKIISSHCLCGNPVVHCEHVCACIDRGRAVISLRLVWFMERGAIRVRVMETTLDLLFQTGHTHTRGVNWLCTHVHTHILNLLVIVGFLESKWGVSY